MGRLTPGSYGSDKLLFWLVAKIPRDVWDEWGATAEHKARTLTYADLSVLLLELALEKESYQHLNAYRPGGGNSRNDEHRRQGHDASPLQVYHYPCLLWSPQALQGRVL